MARTAWTRVWTTTPRACGVRTSSRASRRRWRSTPPAAGGKSSSRMRARCTVSDRGKDGGDRQQNLLPQTHGGASPSSTPPTPKAASPGAAWGGGSDPRPLPPRWLSLPLPPSLSALPDRLVWRSRQAGSGRGWGAGALPHHCLHGAPQTFPAGPGDGDCLPTPSHQCLAQLFSDFVGSVEAGWAHWCNEFRAGLSLVSGVFRNTSVLVALCSGEEEDEDGQCRQGVVVAQGAW